MLLNRNRAQIFMEKYGIDALLATSRENVTYFTEFPAARVPWAQSREYHAFPGSSAAMVQSYAILPKEGEPTLVIPLSQYPSFAQYHPRVDAVWIYEDLGGDRYHPAVAGSNGLDGLPELRRFVKGYTDDTKKTRYPWEALVKALKSLGLQQSKLGLDTEGISPRSRSHLRKVLPHAQINAASELIKFIRIAKTPEELRRMREGAEVNERLLEGVIDKIAEGVSESDLGLHYYKLVSEIESNEIEPFPLIFATRGAVLFPASGRKVRRKELCLVDLHCLYQGYYADTGESAIVGTPDEKQRRVYDTSFSAVQIAADLAQPGIAPSQVSHAMDRVWEKSGIGTAGVLGYGEGAGLGGRDYPIITALFKEPLPQELRRIQDDFINYPVDLPFEENMVINFESPYAAIGWGSVQVEQTYVITKSGCKPLFHQDRHLRVM